MGMLRIARLAVLYTTLFAIGGAFWILLLYWAVTSMWGAVVFFVVFFVAAHCSSSNSGEDAGDI